MSAAADLIKKLPAAYTGQGSDCTIQFNVSTPMYVVLAGGSCKAVDGTAANSDLAITMEDDDFVQLMKGELNGMTAFMTGKLQIDGDLMLAQQLANYFDSSKLA